MTSIPPSFLPPPAKPSPSTSSGNKEILALSKKLRNTRLGTLFGFAAIGVGTYWVAQTHHSYDLNKSSLSSSDSRRPSTTPSATSVSSPTSDSRHASKTSSEKSVSSPTSEVTSKTSTPSDSTTVNTSKPSGWW